MYFVARFDYPFTPSWEQPLKQRLNFDVLLGGLLYFSFVDKENFLFQQYLVKPSTFGRGRALGLAWSLGDSKLEKLKFVFVGDFLKKKII